MQPFNTTVGRSRTSSMWPAIKNIWERFVPRRQKFLDFKKVFEEFQTLLENHRQAMELIADLGEKSGGDYIFDRKYLVDIINNLQDLLLRMVKSLNLIASNKFTELYSTLDKVFLPLEMELNGRRLLPDAPYVVSLKDAPVDNPELTGGKANTLTEIMHRMQIPVPNGFVITGNAYDRFLDYNGLRDGIHGWIEAWVSGKEDLSKVSGQIRSSISAGIIPQDLAREIAKYTHKTKNSWAVRSSAYGEDGELSFAGLHESVLNTLPEQVPEAYKRVLAGLFSQEALMYRMEMGMIGEEPSMSVLCQEMIHSQAAGVMQTVYVEQSDPYSLVMYGSFGLGRTVVEGGSPSDRFIIEKKPPHTIISRDIAGKDRIIVPAATGGGEEEICPDDNLLNQPCISDDAITEIAKWGVTLERYFKRPQELEWAVDPKGKCWLLQSRRLVLPDKPERPENDVCESCLYYPVLISDKGTVAHAGVGVGRVRIIHSSEEMSSFPDGAVLVARYTAPWLAQVVPRAAAVITERGSPAGHLATIAREFRVPALVGVEGATDILHDGIEITLDTHYRTVYEGRVAELLKFEVRHSMVFEESPEFRLVRRLLKRIAPLNLVDPQSQDFNPAGCRSVHDMIRFIHEKAVQELIDLPTFLHRFKEAKVWTLASDVPLDLKILDLGDGISLESKGDKISIDQVTSLPLEALWTGISQKDGWSTEPVDVDFKGLMSSLTRGWDASGATTSAAGFNMAVISKTYLNLHLRLGYHFNLIDVRMDDDPQYNHIYFRFVGGVTDITRRSRRAQVLARILSKYHFNVVMKGDFIAARLHHLSKEEIQQCLHVLGSLIGFSRQLDIRLRSDQDIDRFAEEFFHRQAGTERH